MLGHSGNLIGSIFFDLDHNANAVAAFQQATNFYKTHLYLCEGNSTPALRGLADGLHTLGRLMTKAGQPTDAIVAYEEAIQIRHRLVQLPNPAERDGRDLENSEKALRAFNLQVSK